MENSSKKKLGMIQYLPKVRDEKMLNTVAEQNRKTLACIEEIAYYCKLEKHTGALLLAGKWGSGKTHLLKHVVAEKLKESHVFVFVSLFGISGVEELRKAVKTAWLSQKGLDEEKIQKGQALLGKLSGALSNLNKISIASNITKGIVAINFIDFISVEKMIAGKKVVLIFDDLERSTLSTRDVLGVVNDYCENQEFPVIVVANEENINRPVEGQGLSYDEIKEKIVQTTVYLEPEYQSIIPTLIDELADAEDYRSFLHQLENTLILMLSGFSPEGVRLDEIGIHNCRADGRFEGKKAIHEEEQRKRALLDQRPHNLRIVKTAILEFSRVFKLLNQYGCKDREKWLFSFLTASMMIKTGLAKEDPEYHWSFLGSDISVLFPGYYERRCMHDSILIWQSKGMWDENSFIRYIESIRTEEQKKNDPKYQIRHWKINVLDEDVIAKEFPAVIEDAYAGKLTLKEYAVTIQNSAIAKEYDFTLPVEIDWTRYEEGIITRLKALIDENRREDEIDAAIHYIVLSSSDNLSDEERHAWILIKNSEDNRDLFFDMDKRQFLAYLSEDYHAAFRYAIGNEFCLFDEEMATGIYDVYHAADNTDKNLIVQNCEKWFTALTQNPEFHKEESVCGFAKLEASLTEILPEYEGKAFSRAYTKRFLEIIKASQVM